MSRSAVIVLVCSGLARCTHISIRAMLVAIAATFLANAIPASAQVNPREADPAAWLRQVYDLYKRVENKPELSDQASYRLVVDRASKSLSELFKRNDACETEGQGICALDWDFIIDGQDFKLSKIKVDKTVITGDQASVTVSFKNFDAPCVNVYRFVREDGQWKVDDVETARGSEAPLSIAKLLRDYDYKQ